MKWGRISPESLNLFWGHLHYFSGGPNLGPNLDFFEQSGPKKVWIDHQKSELVDENNATKGLIWQ